MSSREPPSGPEPGHGPPGGALARNLVGFVRLLRRAGVRCGAGSSIDALRALEAVGLGRREDVFWALHAVLVTRREDLEIFRRAFEEFWQHDTGAGALADAAGQPAARRPPRRRPGSGRVRPPDRPAAPAASRRRPPRDDLDVLLAWSGNEVSRTRDFEQMTPSEAESARRVIRLMRPALPHRPTRRLRGDPRGSRLDLRRSLRSLGRSGHGAAPLRWSRPETRPLDVVLLLDISGSMDRYARVLLHFAHALTRASPRVHTFVFGTRLTNVTRQLRARDPDAALEALGRSARDWSGGTRIGAALEAFNRRWSRRILARGAVVLLVTDGLDRDGAAGISREAARLRRSCRRLVWLNPLLRYRGFEPRAAGIRALVAEVDEHRPIHDLESLDQLARALGRW